MHLFIQTRLHAGAAESGRDYNVADISQRTLHEVYLPPFRDAVAAGAACMMPAFNEVGGVPSTASSYLIRRVLRRRMGFKGLVVSDYYAIAELLNHGIVPDEAAAAGFAPSCASFLSDEKFKSMKTKIYLY